jgi:hypothetical protein
MELYNPCKFSFVDLLYAADELNLYKELMNMTQEHRNTEVKRLCKKAKWYYKDVKFSDGVVYTAFSPRLK